MAINLSHGGTTIYSSTNLSKQILVGTREGAITVERDGNDAGWRVTHRVLTDKHISALMSEPESGLLFAPVEPTGVWMRSTTIKRSHRLN